MKKLITTLVFDKNAIFPKIGEIAENCDHNIDPWSSGGNDNQYTLRAAGAITGRFD
jgi:hypothetical protein